MRISLLVLAGMACVSAADAHPASTLAQVRAAAELPCGINRAATDFSKNDTHGNLAALDADICKAVGVAVLGPTAKIVIRALPDETRALRALKQGSVALIAGATPSALHRHLYSVGFGPTIFEDGQGFLINNASGVRKLDDFEHKQICYIANTRADTTLTAEFRRRGIHFVPFPFEEQGEMEAALFTGHCAAVTADLSQLADTRYGFRNGATAFHLADEIIAADPLAPAYRLGDAQWASIIDRTVTLLLLAERSGITSLNVDALSARNDPALAHLIEVIARPVAETPQAPGLEPGWVVRVIEAVGNYGEVYDRDLGARSPLHLPRRANDDRLQTGDHLQTGPVAALMNR